MPEPAQPLIVEDGSSKSDATSYWDILSVDDYHTAHTNSVSWSGATSTTKTTALLMATQYLDAVYGEQWQGTRSKKEQRLDWPRLGILDRDGFVILSTIMPRNLLEAVAELALRHITETGGLLPDIGTDAQDVKRTKDKVGPLESEIEYFGSGEEFKQFSIVDRLLESLLEPEGIVERG